MGSKARPPLRQVGTRVLERLWSGTLVRHIAVLLRKEDTDVEGLNHLCHAIGAGIAGPLAELLAVEENPRASRLLRELLLSYGAAGRQSVERLKHSQNPAVRRMAVDMLRVFGGQEALGELASMLDDPDPQVQKESIRAIVQIGTTNAYAVLQRALVAEGASRDTILRELLDLKDDKTVPLLCYVVRQTEPEGKLYHVHANMIDAIGNLKAHADSVRTLRQALYRGKWWSPFRSSALRHRAALALRRLGTPDAKAALQEAVNGKSRGARRAARAQLAGIAQTEPTKA
jgi:HEAT repeat protein